MGRSLRRIALIVAVATALSKVAGLVRQQVIAAAFPIGHLRLDGANRPKPRLQASGLNGGAHQCVG